MFWWSFARKQKWTRFSYEVLLCSQVYDWRINQNKPGSWKVKLKFATELDWVTSWECYLILRQIVNLPIQSDSTLMLCFLICRFWFIVVYIYFHIYFPFFHFRKFLELVLLYPAKARYASQSVSFHHKLVPISPPLLYKISCLQHSNSVLRITTSVTKVYGSFNISKYDK